MMKDWEAAVLGLVGALWWALFLGYFAMPSVETMAYETIAGTVAFGLAALAWGGLTFVTLGAAMAFPVIGAGHFVGKVVGGSGRGMAVVGFVFCATILPINAFLIEWAKP